MAMIVGHIRRCATYIKQTDAPWTPLPSSLLFLTPSCCFPPEQDNFDMTRAVQSLIDIKQADALAPLTRLPLTPSFALFPSIPTHPFYVHQGNSDMTKALQNLIDIKQADALAPLTRLPKLPLLPSSLRSPLIPFTFTRATPT
jgi:hypothetical protein